MSGTAAGRHAGRAARRSPLGALQRAATRPRAFGDAPDPPTPSAGRRAAQGRPRGDPLPPGTYGEADRGVRTPARGPRPPTATAATRSAPGRWIAGRPGAGRRPDAVTSVVCAAGEARSGCVVDGQDGPSSTVPAAHGAARRHRVPGERSGAGRATRSGGVSTGRRRRGRGVGRRRPAGQRSPGTQQGPDGNSVGALLRAPCRVPPASSRVAGGRGSFFSRAAPAAGHRRRGDRRW